MSDSDSTPDPVNTTYDDMQPYSAEILEAKVRQDAHDSSNMERTFLNRYKYDAIVAKLGPTNDSYIVDIFENGYLAQRTRAGIVAYVTHVKDFYIVDERLRVHMMSDNTALIVHEEPEVFGRIVQGGPRGEPDFASDDPRYWVTFSHISNTDLPPSILTIIRDSVTVPAINLMEMNGASPSLQSTHNLPAGTLVKMKWGWDNYTPLPNRRWVIETFALSIGDFCDQREVAGSPGVPDVYRDHKGRNQLSFHVDDFNLTSDVINARRQRVEWSGFTVGTDYFGLSACKVGIVQFHQEQVFKGSGTNPINYASVQGWDEHPIITQVTNPKTDLNSRDCQDCDPTPLSTAFVDQKIYIDPCRNKVFVSGAGLSGVQVSAIIFGAGLNVIDSGSGCNHAVIVTATAGDPSVYNAGILVGSFGQFDADPAYRMAFQVETILVANDTAVIRWLGIQARDYSGFSISNGSASPSADGWQILKTGLGVVLSDSAGSLVFTASGFLGFDCGGSPLNGASLSTGGGFTAIKGINGVNTYDGTAGLMMVTLAVSSSDNSILITPTTCNLDIKVNPSILTGFGLTATDCSGVVSGGPFTSVTSTTGISLSNLGGSLGIGLSIVAGTYTVIGTSGCSLTVDVDPSFFDLAGAATGALSGANSYTDSQIIGLSGSLSGTYDPLGAAAAAQTAAEQYPAGNPANWAGAPTTKNAALDRIAAFLAGLFGPIP